MNGKIFISGIVLILVGFITMYLGDKYILTTHYLGLIVLTIGLMMTLTIGFPLIILGLLWRRKRNDN